MYEICGAWSAVEPRMHWAPMPWEAPSIGPSEKPSLVGLCAMTLWWESNFSTMRVMFLRNSWWELKIFKRDPKLENSSPLPLFKDPQTSFELHYQFIVGISSFLFFIHKIIFVPVMNPRRLPKKKKWFGNHKINYKIFKIGLIYFVAKFFRLWKF